MSWGENERAIVDVKRQEEEDEISVLLMFIYFYKMKNDFLINTN